MSDNRPFRRLRRDERKADIKGDRDFLKKDLPPDLPDLSLLAGDDEDVAQLAAMPEGLVARPLTIAPPEERYPPTEAPRRARPIAPVPIASSIAPVPRPRIGLNLLTLVLLLGSVGVWMAVASIWQDPYSLLNPLPPPIVRVFITATFLPPTPTLATTPLSGSVVSDGAAFGLSAAGVQYRANTNGRGCEWASIGGTVTAADDSALVGYRVQITGESVNSTAFSGTAAAFGAGGFEFSLGAAPLASSYLVQLLSPDGTPLSELVAVETRAACEEAIAVVNFRAR